MIQLYTHMYAYMYTCVLSGVQLYAAPWTVACQAPLSMEFSRQVYWSQLPLPARGDLPDLLHWRADSLAPAPPGKWCTYIYTQCTQWCTYMHTIPCWLPTLYIVVNICQSQTPNLSCTPPFGTLVL